MSTIEQIQSLPLHEKLQVMESIWDDLSRQTSNVEVPQWHKDILDERERLLQEGNARFINWDDAKKEIEAATS